MRFPGNVVGGGWADFLKLLAQSDLQMIAAVAPACRCAPFSWGGRSLLMCDSLKRDRQFNGTVARPLAVQEEAGDYNRHKNGLTYVAGRHGGRPLQKGVQTSSCLLPDRGCLLWRRSMVYLDSHLGAEGVHQVDSP